MTDLAIISSPFIVAIGAMVIMLIDLFVPHNQKHITAYLSIFALLLSVVFVWANRALTDDGFFGMVVADGISRVLDVLFALIGVGVILLSLRYNSTKQILRGEFFALLLFSICGMMLMGHARNLLMVFIALELLSIPLYVLCGIARPRFDSEESALKYFLLGAFASGFLVFGIALVYGATGSLDLAALNSMLNVVRPTPLFVIGAGLILIGLAFKVAAVPFHMWTPDVYDGAPTTVTAFMATATKAAGFVALIRVFAIGFAPAVSVWQMVIVALAALTIIIGNVLAVAQKNVKRLIAYSSIAHAGYLLVGVAAGQGAISSILFYLVSYAITVMAALGVMSVIGSVQNEDHDISHYAGLAKRQPVLAWSLTVALFSLMGMPLTAGFVGKYVLFQSAVSAHLTALALIGVVGSVISAYYYLRVIVAMFMRDPDEQEGGAITVSPASLLIIGAATLAVIIFGILPMWLLNAMPTAAQAMR